MLKNLRAWGLFLEVLSQIMHKHIIVHIDDDKDDLELVAAIIRKNRDVEVIQAVNGQEGLLLLESLAEKKRNPCLVLLDINMPILDGKAALVKLRSHPQLKDLPVTLFSTSTSPLDMKFASKYNASYATKPFNLSALHELIDSFISDCSEEE